MWREFREFAMRGNVLDLAVGIIIGAAFGTIVNSLVNDVIMPPVGLLLGQVDFADIFILLSNGDPVGPYRTLAEAQAAGAITINVGLFVNAVVNFVIVAFAVFLIVRAINRMQRRANAEEAAAPPAPDPLVESQRKLTEAVDQLTRTLQARQ